VGDSRPSNGTQGDRLVLDIACISRKCRRATLVSTTGNHCTVWRGALRSPDADATANPGTETETDEVYTEFVIKLPRERYDAADARILVRQYRMLREALGEVVPSALFVVGLVDGIPSLLVIARAVNLWFNIANPQNRDEAIGLLRNSSIARDQLRHFLDQAARWRSESNPRVIDLYGLDNLVMDNRRQIRFVDSFYVFFFEDMLHLLGGEPDHDLEDKIKVSLQRLAYLDEILRAAESTV
jgi:hypothetical protein